MPRDDFLERVKETLAKRVAYHCSNPDCYIITSGPHTDISKSINIGVASHITAAAPGGPRYNTNLTAEKRSSIENGIWLCQSCSKLIDTDEKAYTIAILNEWKASAERRILEFVKHTSKETFYPQPANANHTPIPKIRSLTYEIAREKLINAGWQPMMHKLFYQFKDITLQLGNGKYFWSKGFYEIENACPTGPAYCTFIYSDVYKNRLIVVTAGEVFEEKGIFPHVWSWHFENKSKYDDIPKYRGSILITSGDNDKLISFLKSNNGSIVILDSIIDASVLTLEQIAFVEREFIDLDSFTSRKFGDERYLLQNTLGELFYIKFHFTPNHILNYSSGGTGIITISINGLFEISSTFHSGPSTMFHLRELEIPLEARFGSSGDITLN